MKHIVSWEHYQWFSVRKHLHKNLPHLKHFFSKIQLKYALSIKFSSNPHFHLLNEQHKSYVKCCMHTCNKLKLTLSMLWKNFSRHHFEIFFTFSPENRIRHFMQIVSIGDNLHAMSNPIFWEKQEKIFENVVCRNYYPACPVLNLPYVLCKHL